MLLITLGINGSFGQLVVPQGGYIEHFGKHLTILEDPNGSMGVNQVIASANFRAAEQDVPNLNISKSTFWAKFEITNQTDEEHLILDLAQPNLDEVTFYSVEGDRIDSLTYGDFTPVNQRKYKNQNYVFDLNLGINQTKTFFLRVRAYDQIQLPLAVGTVLKVHEHLNFKDILFGIFAGIMLAILLYNMFIYFKTKERIYGLYILYLGVIFVTQANLQGYTLRFFWPGFPLVERYSAFVLIALSGISGLIFIMYYINVKLYFKAVVKLFFFFIAVYVVTLGLVGLKMFDVALKILEINGSIIALSVLAITTVIWRRGNKQAGNLLIAWSAFFLGLFIFVMKDLGVLPNNDFTVYTMTIGSAIEGILLSFGLADKINQLKLEKEQADAERIRTIESQNEILEVKVHERTSELEVAKDQLQAQYDHLRIAQKQLVESEKLAGLGQMTAGIAHELNNPINFVSSNVGPLHRDIEDVVTMLNEYYNLPDNPDEDQIRQLREKYKKLSIDFVQKEIHMLLKGIEEGSRRTAEIVKGLRIFARADKDTLVQANINECLHSTIVVMKSITKGHVTLDLNFDSHMPYVDCFPGKLNQVIANLISNAVQATKMDGRSVIDRKVSVTSWFDNDFVHISVKDNGCGIPESELEKIFVPFYTTKSVGEGTGLGLSIAMGIVEEHQGEIEVKSEPGSGSEFIVHLPRIRRATSLSAA